MNNIFGAVVFYLTKKFSLKNVMRVSLLIRGILFIILVIVPVLLPNETGFYATLVIISLIGAVNSVYNSSSNGFVSMFPGHFIADHFFGTGLAGLLMNLLGALFLALMKQDERGKTISSLVYFAVSTALLIICAIIFEFFIKSTFA